MSDPDRLPIELPREWLRYAEGDLRVAEREWDDLLPEGEVLNEYVIAGRYPGDLCQFFRHQRLPVKGFRPRWIFGIPPPLIGQFW